MAFSIKRIKHLLFCLFDVKNRRRILKSDTHADVTYWYEFANQTRIGSYSKRFFFFFSLVTNLKDKKNVW